MYTVKISAYHIETQLMELLQGNYANRDDEGRTLVAAALRSSGSLRLEPGRIVIQLEPQAEPRRTRAINAVAAELSRRQVRYPGSRRVIAFEPTEVPPPIPRRFRRVKVQQKNRGMSGVQESHSRENQNDG